jgi:hypothetical protein
MLIPRCQGSPTRLNVDRRRVSAASRCNPRWPPETGSSNNFACIIGRNTISNANTTFSRSPTRLNVDRHRVSAKSRCNQRWPPETGSSNNFACITCRNAISKANTTFSRVANTTERRPTPSTSCILVYSKMAARNRKQ